MSETLGSLCDKLIIFELKRIHTNDASRLDSLRERVDAISTEIDEFLHSALSNQIPMKRLVVKSNKVFNEEKFTNVVVASTIGSSIEKLSTVNFMLWKEQEKVYDFEKVPADEKNSVITNLAQLNLDRNALIEKIDEYFLELLVNRK